MSWPQGCEPARYADGVYPAPAEVVERVTARLAIDVASGCWLWPGATSSGYGRVRWTDSAGVHWGAAHRIMYAAKFGAIPEGLDVDHQCHDPATCQPARPVDCPHRRCCNPDHLAAMSRRDNLLRGGTITADRAATTHCPQGHPYDERNTMMSKKGQRECRECRYARNRAYYWKNREKRRAYNRAYHARRKEKS